MKKIMCLVLVFALLCGGFAYADYWTNRKLDFVTALSAFANDSLDLQSKAAALYQEYNKNGYGTGNANEIVVGDLSGSVFENLAISDIIAGIVYAEQITKLYGNQAVTQGDYAATIEKLAK